MSPAPDELVKVSVHELKYERKPAGGLVVEHLLQGDDVLVGAQPSQRLNLPQIVHLVSYAVRDIS